MRALQPNEGDRKLDLDFDPVAEGARFGLSRQRSLTLWRRISAATADSYEAQQRFLAQAANLAERGGQKPDIGKISRAGSEGTNAVNSAARPATPGRDTLVSSEAQRLTGAGGASGAAPGGAHDSKPRAPGKDKGKPAGKHKDLPSPTQGLTADAHKIGAHEAPGAKHAAAPNKKAAAPGAPSASGRIHFAPTDLGKLLPPIGANETVEQRRKTERATLHAHEAARAHATEALTDYVSSANQQADGMRGLAPGMEAQLRAGESHALASVDAAAAQQVASVQAAVSSSIAQASAAAAAAHAQLEADHKAALQAIEQSITAAKQQVEQSHTAKLAAIDKQQADQLTLLGTLYSQAADKFRAAGATAGQHAVAVADAAANEYLSHMIHRSDSFWDGHLTDNRCKARADAAKKVGEAYRDGLAKEAEKQIGKLNERRPTDEASVRQIADQARTNLETAHKQSIDALDQAQKQSNAAADQTKTAISGQIDSACASTISSLQAHGQAQTRAIHGQAGQTKAGISHQRAAAATAIHDGIESAIGSIRKSTEMLVAGLNGAPVPEEKALDAALAHSHDQLGKQITQMRASMAQGVATSAQGLAQAAATGAAQIKQTGAQAVASAHSTLASARASFTQMQAGGAKALQQLADGAKKNADATAKAADKGFESITKGLGDSYTTLAKNFRDGAQKNADAVRDGFIGAVDKDEPPKIQEEADKAAAQVQPRWKSIVKWVIIIAIVLVVAIVIGPMVIGAVAGAAAALGASAAVAGVVGAVVGGAIVGAASSALTTVVDNAFSGRSLFEGVGEAAMWGAIGGAVGGAVSSALGPAIKGLSVVARVAITTTSDTIVNTGLSLLQGNFSWESFGQGLALSLLTNGVTAHPKIASISEHFEDSGKDFGKGVGEKIKPPKIDVSTSGAGSTPAPKIEAPPAPKVEAPPAPKTEGGSPPPPKQEPTGGANAPKQGDAPKPSGDAPKIPGNDAPKTSTGGVDEAAPTQNGQTKPGEGPPGHEPTAKGKDPAKSNDPAKPNDPDAPKGDAHDPAKPNDPAKDPARPNEPGKPTDPANSNEPKPTEPGKTAPGHEPGKTEPGKDPANSNEPKPKDPAKSNEPGHEPGREPGKTEPGHEPGKDEPGHEPAPTSEAPTTEPGKLPEPAPAKDDPSQPVGPGGYKTDAISLTGTGDALGEAAKWVKPEPGKTDVVVHGDSDNFYVLKDGNYVPLDHRALAKYIEKNGGPGKAVRLISCGTGESPTSIAQHLANKLGVPVTAPTDTVWVHPDGHLSIGKNPDVETGGWNTFSPGTKPEIKTPTTGGDHAPTPEPGVAPPTGEHGPGTTPAHPEPGEPPVAAGKNDKPTNTPESLPENLKAIRDGLTGDAQKQFDDMWAKAKNPEGLKRALDGMSGGKPENLQDALAQRYAGVQAAKEIKPPYGPAADKAPVAKEQADQLQKAIEDARGKLPDKVVKDLLKNLNDERRPIDRAANGKEESTDDLIKGPSMNITSIEAEFRVALNEHGVTEMGKDISTKGANGKDAPIELDVVANGGKKWIEVKNKSPFGKGSSNWSNESHTNSGRGVKQQAELMLKAAKENLVDGVAPEVEFNFPKGVSKEIHDELVAMGVKVNGEIKPIHADVETEGTTTAPKPSDTGADTTTTKTTEPPTGPTPEGPVSAGPVSAGPKKPVSADPHDGISGGKTSHDDFLGTPATDAERTTAHNEAQHERGMSLDDQAASIATGTARSERDMLLAIQNGEVPRFIARVGPSDNFGRGTFANPNRPFSFAAEPADLRGVSPAEAMYKVGWTKEWIEPNIGKEIVVVVLDTSVEIPGATAGAAGNKIEVGRMEWPELKAKALGDADFVHDAEAAGIPATDLPGLFDTAAQTPVKGAPTTGDPAQLAKLRNLIDRKYGANDLYTGMGATMNERGGLGGREVMLEPNGTGLKLTPDNHRKVSLGVMTQAQFDALFPPTTGPTSGGTP